MRATPEEVEAVQIFSKILVEDYGYPKEYIQTRPQYRVKVRPSDTKKEYPVDIAVFLDTNKTDESAYIIVECKKKNRKDGRSQLEDYLRLSSAELGVLFNGNEKLFLRKQLSINGKITFSEIPNIPKFGESIEKVGLLKREDLRPTNNLKSIFKTIRNYLAANAVGTTRDEVLAQQIINCIFCKIFDERFPEKGNVMRFRASVNESHEEIKNRIDELFIDVKKKYREVFSDSDRINLDSVSVSYIVGELQNYCLIETRSDVISDAFETFIDHALKGGEGQFFTPRNIIKMIVGIMNPNENELIIDPACGSGGFLIESLKCIWDKFDETIRGRSWSDDAIREEKIDLANKCIRGIDKDYVLSKITKAYMAVMKDGKGGIFCTDSLDNPKNWNNDIQKKIVLGTFDVVMTNPPFGSKIPVTGEEKLKQYDLSYKYKENNVTGEFERKGLKEKEAPQLLFIDRCFQLLKNGGRMAIILPETYFHAPSVKYVISHIENGNNIFGVIDLPHNTFRPHCNAKCVVLFVQKKRPQQEQITMGIVEQMGHNHQGKDIFRFDDNGVITDELWDDTKDVEHEFVRPNDPSNKLVFTVNKNDIKKHIYVPRYYWNRNTFNILEKAEKEGYYLVTMQELIEKKVIYQYKGHGAPPSEYKGKGDVFYVRAGDIMDWDIYKNPTSAIPYKIYKEMVLDKPQSFKLLAKDILFVKEGSYRVGDVAILSDLDTNIFLNHHTLVFRVNPNNEYNIDPFYLLFMLSHELTRKQFFNKIMIDTTLPNIGDRWLELMLPIHRDINQMQNIKERLKRVFEEKWRIQTEIQKLKSNLLIEDNFEN